jgi:quercetin dioxygenase-like cupin family protein
VEPQFISFTSSDAFPMAAGVTARPLFGDGAMINLVELEPDAVVALHSHPMSSSGSSCGAR